MAAPPWFAAGVPARPRRQSLLRAFGALPHWGCRPTFVGTALAEALGEAVPRRLVQTKGILMSVRLALGALARGPLRRLVVRHSTPMAEDPAPPRVSASPASSRGTAAAKARERDVARSPAPVPSGVCTPLGAGLERAAGSVRSGEQVPAASLSRPAEGDVRTRHAFFDLVQVLQRQASAPLRFSDASFGLLRAMGTVDVVLAVTQLFVFHQQGSAADLWIKNVATSKELL
ncbi:unnamed protein product [Prorocentrum cordatum]|uniref:Uncharacterized protein n=1 Tax=Prorocentrum cordatum TaxID=2364126 RepID=A0ABN9S9T4_9DINO|nr:unnamed protein product [Polarella glacialis]